MATDTRQPASSDLSRLAEGTIRDIETLIGQHFDLLKTEMKQEVKGNGAWAPVLGLTLIAVGAGSAANADEFRAHWKARGALSAVKAGKLVFVDADTIQRPTLRLVDGVAQLCRGLDEARRP